MRIASFFISLFLILFIFSCTTTEPPDKEDPPDPVVIPSLALTEDDTHCVESWLKLSADSLELPAELVLWQYNPAGDSVSILINIAANDTLLHIDSLLPDKEYSFIAAFPEPDSLHPSSNIVTVTTMDTTSHDFTFDMLTFGGETGSSYLYDVAIINENNIWAVGQIYIKDSSLIGYTNYNAVHWDGNRWELKRIFYHYGNNSACPAIRSVFAFSENDIWFGFANLVHWDGNEFVSVEKGDEFQSLINEMWGTGNDNLYIVGNEGNIARYNGAEWTALASGTTLNINDIWGDYNEKTGQWEILAVAGNILHGHKAEIILINNNNCVITGANEIVWPLRTVWFDSPKEYFVAGSGIFQKHNIQDKNWGNDIFQITTYSINKIRGDKINNLIAVGGVGELLHFNGYNWKSFIEQSKLDGGNYYGCAIENNLMVAVGQNNASAVLTMLLEF